MLTKNSPEHPFRVSVQGNEKSEHDTVDEALAEGGAQAALNPDQPVSIHELIATLNYTPDSAGSDGGSGTGSGTSASGSTTSGDTSTSGTTTSGTGTSGSTIPEVNLDLAYPLSVTPNSLEIRVGLGDEVYRCTISDLASAAGRYALHGEFGNTHPDLVAFVQPYGVSIENIIADTSDNYEGSMQILADGDELIYSNSSVLFAARCCTRPIRFGIQPAWSAPNPDMLPKYMATAGQDDWTPLYEERDNTINGKSLAAYDNQGATGGRTELGLLPGGDVQHLLQMTEQSWAICRGYADSGAVWPVHVHDRATGRPLKITDHPDATLDRNQLGAPGNPISTQTNSPYTPNVAHLPGYGIVALLCSPTDKFLQREVECWAGYVPLEYPPGKDGDIEVPDSTCEYRGRALGLLPLTKQIRGAAWGLRSIAYAALIGGDDLKPYFDGLLDNNRRWFDYHFTGDAADLASPLHIVIMGSKPFSKGYGTPTAYGFSPWQQNFLLAATALFTRLGFSDWQAMTEYLGKGAVDRVTTICAQLCSLYGFQAFPDGLSQGELTPATMFNSYAESVQAMAASDPDFAAAIANPCGSAELIRGITGNDHYEAGDMYGYPWSPQGYPTKARGALVAAAWCGVDGAAEALNYFAQQTTQPDFTHDAEWAFEL